MFNSTEKAYVKAVIVENHNLEQYKAAGKEVLINEDVNKDKERASVIDTPYSACPFLSCLENFREVFIQYGENTHVLWRKWKILEDKSLEPYVVKLNVDNKEGMFVMWFDESGNTSIDSDSGLEKN